MKSHPAIAFTLFIFIGNALACCEAGGAWLWLGAVDMMVAIVVFLMFFESDQEFGK